jgi:hypothetical protein
METDHEFACPYCWQPITMRLDLSAGGQEYIEDCEVCCNPIQIAYTVRNGEVVSFEANDIGQ